MNCAMGPFLWIGSLAEPDQLFRFGIDLSVFRRLVQYPAGSDGGLTDFADHPNCSAGAPADDGG